MKKQQFKWAGISPFFHHSVIFNFIPHELAGKTIVDAGAGKGIYGFLLRTTRDLGKTNLIATDVAKEYLDIARFHKVYDKYLVEDLAKMSFKNKSVDIFMCIEVIPCLPKKDGRKMLKEIDRVTSERAIIVCPNLQKHRQNPYSKTDAHNSTWSAEEFRDAGYKVYGFGLRLPPPKGLLLNKIYFAFQYIATPFTYFVPVLAAHLVAVKDY
ncbi:MAG: hypothetical protein US96_C0006G0017 [Candidatus Woesebacteria bacterium GW2011_GWB1_38_5b]|uniref:Methyltransferase type 11 domain-containing protein n=1 Tax=Candidatus Woesebacteria bacterium GW2011_GWB1_38_5b TaxID=1618569 RepID=A0A0G0KJM0_9BACT|nr:MAG: hypothetical protein US96_C0006G0017 [Candidatus Woesebacteria bacterium GW2011_GWB1_38_5b]